MLCECVPCRWFRTDGFAEGVSAHEGEACQGSHRDHVGDGAWCVDCDVIAKECDMPGCTCRGTFSDGECEGCWLWSK
jgi:hypothetical protein